MPKAELNRIRNSDFRAGGQAPTGWRWEALAGSPTWRLDGRGSNGDGRVLILESDNDKSVGQWVQSFRCRSRHDYRIEVRASCQSKSPSHKGGLRIRVRSFCKDRLMPGSEKLSDAWRSSKTALWRMRYRTPAGATRLEVAVRLEGMRGSISLDRVRAIPMDYAACEAHPLSTPPWPYVCPPPRRVASVTVVDTDDRAGRLRALLRARFGARVVRAIPSKRLPAAGTRTDALIISSVEPMPGFLAFDKIMKWASRQMVVLSLPAFEQIVNQTYKDCVRLRNHRQADDTLGARVDYANFITNGFALHDTLDFSVYDDSDASFRQRQIIRSAALRDFMKAQSMSTILTSDTNMDHTSGRGICLCKEIEGGGLVVLDCDPLLSTVSNEDNANPVVQLWMNILGAETVSLGQFADPYLSGIALAEQFRSLGLQIPGVHVRWVRPRDGGGATPGQGARPVCRINGGRDASCPSRSPAFVIRSGLDETGRHGIEGVMTWFKALVRMEPCKARYAPMLLSQRDVLWVPFGRDHGARQLAEFVGGHEVGLLIDVVPTDRNVLRVVAPERGGEYAVYFQLLGQFDAQFRQGRIFGWLPAAGALLADRDRYGWRNDEAVLEVLADKRAFHDEPLELPAAFRRLRVEVPAVRHSSPGQSICDSERVALLLEFIAGLEIGGAVVNRDPRPRTIALTGGRATRIRRRSNSGGGLARRRPLLIDARGNARPLTVAEAARLTKSGLTLAPGTTLLVSPPRSSET